jgi:hypothetical protein
MNKEVKIPKKFKVLNHTYDVVLEDVVYQSENSQEETDKAIGYCSPESLKIGIAKDLPIEKKYSVLWHEILHAILGELAYGEYYQDETLITYLTIGITEVLDDNKNFFKEYYK